MSISKLALVLALVAMPAAAVIQNPVPTPLARYTFNNNSGTGTAVTADIGGDCPVITATWGEDPVSSGNYYLVFNGTTSLAPCTANAPILGLESLSIAAFIQFTGFGEGGVGRVATMSQSASANLRWSLSISNSGAVDRTQIAMQSDAGGTDRFQSEAGSMSAYEDSGNWVFVAGSLVSCASMACTGGPVYIDGLPVSITQPQNATTSSPRDDSTGFVLQLGSNGAGAETFEGFIDDVEIYSPPMTKFQVEYRKLRGRLPLVPEAPDAEAINETDCATDFADWLVDADRFDEKPIALWGASGSGCDPNPGVERQ